MSGTLGSIHDNVSYALSLHTRALDKLGEQMATGSRVNRVSDDPSSASRILRLNSQESSLDSHIDAISGSMGALEMSLSMVEELISIYSKAQVDMTQITSGIYSDDDRDMMADSINDTLEQVLSLANTRHMDEYLFSGGSTSTAPYAATRTNGEITSVSYQGSLDNRTIEVAGGLETNIYTVGDEIFRSDSRTTPVFIGDSGAAAGSSRSSVRGDVWLTVTHDGSNYKLSIDDGASEVTVPGAGDVSNLTVTDSNTGRILYVDATNITGTGVDMVSVSGTYDIFNVLISTRDILRNDRSLSDDQVGDLRENATSAMNEMENLLVSASVSLGSKVGFLDGIKDSLENMKYDTGDESMRLEQADITQLAIDMAQREVLYEMTLLVAADLMSLSLLNFL